MPPGRRQLVTGMANVPPEVPPTRAWRVWGAKLGGACFCVHKKQSALNRYLQFFLVMTRKLFGRPPSWMGLALPHVQVFSICCSGNGDLSFLAFPAQGGAHILFAVLQSLEWDFQGSASSKTFQIFQNRAHNFAMLAIAALRKVVLLHDFKGALAIYP